MDICWDCHCEEIVKATLFCRPNFVANMDKVQEVVEETVTLERGTGYLIIQSLSHRHTPKRCWASSCLTFVCKQLQGAYLLFQQNATLIVLADQLGVVAQTTSSITRKISLPYRSARCVGFDRSPRDMVITVWRWFGRFSFHSHEHCFLHCIRLCVNICMHATGFKEHE
jgi:hypothetical protein